MSEQKDTDIRHSESRLNFPVTFGLLYLKLQERTTTAGTVDPT